MLRKFRFYLAISRAFYKRDKKKISYGLIAIILIIFTIKILLPTFFPKLIILYKEVQKPTFVEGVVGKPAHPNPLFDTTETQKDISFLVYRGLTKVDAKGNLVMDLAEDLKRKGDKEYLFTLKKDIYWHDGEKFTADDVVYTIQTAQDPQYNSPIASNFKDVSVEKLDDYSVKFTLEEPFTPFPFATNVGIIPNHVPLKKFQPIGTGPFFVKKIDNNKIILANEKLNLVFQFFKDENEAKLALKLGKIHGLGGLSPQGVEDFRVFGGKSAFTHTLPYRQVVVFFNTRVNFLNNTDVRQALSFAIDKKDLTKLVGGDSAVVSRTQLAQVHELTKREERYNFSSDEAKKSLEKAGLKFENTTWMKNKEEFRVKITSVNDLELNSVVNLLKDYWIRLGVVVETNFVAVGDLLTEVIPNRNFEILVNFQELSPDPDQYVLWHTTQTNNANITGIRRAKLDKILEDARKTQDEKKRSQKYKLFTTLLLDEAPAIFLYYPQYVWVVSDKVSGLDFSSFTQPFERFSSFENWKIRRKFF